MVPDEMSREAQDLINRLLDPNPNTRLGCGGEERKERKREKKRKETDGDDDDDDDDDPTILRSERGVEEIKGHIFFKDVNWDTLSMESREDIFVPRVSNVCDTGYFLDRSGAADLNENDQETSLYLQNWSFARLPTQGEVEKLLKLAESTEDGGDDSEDSDFDDEFDPHRNR